MRIAMFYHSLISDWNHGNAHFLRGVATELIARGNDVQIYEPVDSWSLDNLVKDHWLEPLYDFQEYYPKLSSKRYRLDRLDLDRELEGVELVLVHEWNDPELVRRLGEYRRAHRDCRILFHDTHHRMVTDPGAMAAYDLRHYDGVLAFGKVIADLYRERSLAQRAWVWHEAADTRIFRRLRREEDFEGDVVWIGNWGDDERTEELQEFLFKPVSKLRLKARVYSVRYPEHALLNLRLCGIDYGGWVANFTVPEVFARFRATVHVPRRPYARQLPGIPTIRVFETLACGIPLVSAPWQDTEKLFTAGADFLVAHDGAEMQKRLRDVLCDAELARELSERGRQAIVERHTCAHRVNELFGILKELEAA